MTENCPNKQRNLEACNCTYGGCEKKGICCECIAYHRSIRQLPACFFDKSEEATYDRSVEAFVKARKG